ncbi:hypothetical protein MS3_00002541 [Schistosoma haematobium]|uniref:Uncharacterized protein n=1 Tax=Schistosoma haematobium TaxID=6185 RepID=A0A922S194_SCHHA|nr:hypothetical protein MS3_00002541 [Schistosoma haematobium]KAH9589492.1 hypothetical protein MS3_00002541 [Schistosoma haematobium]CAH8639072.1 unnamed protein product [Schistosoma haematobium]CAH8646531.1 unnamed protein product [Schistosoma haematobium]
MLICYILGWIINLCVVSSLSCYQCNSSHHSNCLEHLTDPGKHSLQPTPCTTYGARFCIKTTGIYGAVMGITRFCSAWDMGNECQFLDFPDHDRIYRACVMTCSKDACNLSRRMMISLYSMMIILYIVIYFYFNTIC